MLKLARATPISRAFVTSRTYASQQINIIGASIEGLATAVSLNRLSKSTKPTVRILDTRENIENKKGETVILTSKAIEILKELNLYDEVKSLGNRIGHYVLLDNSNKVIVERNWQQTEHIAISYPRLHKILLGAAQKANALVGMNLSVTDIDIENNKYVIKSKKREVATSDIIIGADGDLSIVREKLFSHMIEEDTKRGVEYNYLIMNTPSEVDFEDRAFEYWGNTNRLAIVPINSKQLGIVSSFKNPETTGERRGRIVVATINQVHKELLKVDAPGYILRALEKDNVGKYTEASGTSPKRVLVRDDVCEGAVLIGDAAHSIDPVLWQPATVGLEDGYELAKHLADQTDLKAALQKYKNTRKSKVNSVNKVSNYFGKQAIKQSHMLVNWWRFGLRNLLGYKIWLKAKLRNLQ